MRVVGGTIGRWASEKPTHTEVTRSGVKPTNQASRHFSPVPVLPATGRPMRACTPVPRCTTCWSTPISRSATQVGRARSRSTWCCQSAVPSALVTLVTNVGVTRMPRLAMVA